MTFRSRWVEIFTGPGTGATDVKKYRFRFNQPVVYKGKTYKRGDTIDLTQEEADANPQPNIWTNIGDAASIDAGSTKINEHLTVLHPPQSFAEAKGMTKFRFVFIAGGTYNGKVYRPGDTVDLTAAAAAANPSPEIWLCLGSVEVLDAKPNVVGPPQTAVDVQRAKAAVIAGSPSVHEQETAMGALQFAETLCRATGVPGPQPPAVTAHFHEGVPATPVDPATLAFSERVKERVSQMRSWGRKESEHILMGEAMKELRRDGVASSSF